MTAISTEAKLIDEIAPFYWDPLAFVRYAYPWGEKGPLQQYDGPDGWQVEFLEQLGAEVRKRNFNGSDPVAPIRMARSSGHGIGKSVVCAWLVDWAMSTRPHCRITVTANSFTQLKTRTWAAIQTWTKRCITGHWFEVTGDLMWHKSHKASWFATAQTCREENSEAFAGQHAADSSSIYIVDEASAVPDKIWEVASGGLTDGEPMFIAFGNPTRNSGAFYRAVFGSEKHRWNHGSIDSRDSRFSNKPLIDEWLQDYGEDSDRFRVRVRGLPPSAGDLQFIDSARVYAAQRRDGAWLNDDPLIVGVDIARGGSDDLAIRFRRGNDGKSIPAVRIPGELVRDSALVVGKLSQILDTYYYGSLYDQGIKPTMMFVDGTGVGGPICDHLKQLGRENVIEVQFAGKSPDPHYNEMRAFMWGKLRDWLDRGAIDSDTQLETDLTGPQYGFRKDKLVLESKEDMKKRGLDSPDDGDALALTFAQPVEPLRTNTVSQARQWSPQTKQHSWMG